MMKRKRHTCRDCDKRPSSGPPGSTKGITCSDHRDLGWVNVKHKTCRDCDKRPNYGPPGSTTAITCADHSELGWVDVNHKTCRDCDKRPNYGPPGSAKGITCAEHRDNTTWVDVTSKMCDLCAMRARYGLLGSVASRCASHKVDGEQTLVLEPRKRCDRPRCRELALWGSSAYTRERCERHRDPSDVSVVLARCLSCGLPEVVDAAGLCACCNPAEQRALFAHLDAAGLPGTSTDRVIDGGACGRERPDRVYERAAGDLVIVLECDEHQHRGSEYTPECERARMGNVGQSFGGVPVLFVRFNPDPYRPLVRSGAAVKITQRYRELTEILSAFMTARLFTDPTTAYTV